MIEPYRIKAVEPIPVTTRTQRRDALARAGYSMFGLRAEEVTIDLLTDSGTGAVSAAQQAAAAMGDESYAGGASWFRFEETVTDLTGYPHVMPVHQGRAAEHLLFSVMLERGQIAVSNTFFDTTRAHILLQGAEPRDLPCPQSQDLDSGFPFKGGIDTDKLEALLSGEDGHHVALCLMTLTNNGGGGQPVSMANLQTTARICRRYGVPMVLDAARFAENAYLIVEREPGFQARTVRQVAQEAFALADGALASLKKDGLSPMGGFLAVRDAQLAKRCEPLLIAREGYPTYGGLTGSTLEMLAQGLREVTDPRYLAARADATRALAEQLSRAGIDIVQPPGIHALYVRADRLLPHLPPALFPGHALACELYLRGGIRSCELGSLFAGQVDADGRLVTPAPHELLRLAIPRRTYTRTHLDYVARVLTEIAKAPEKVPGYRLTNCPPILRHFKATLEPVESTASAPAPKEIALQTG